MVKHSSFPSSGVNYFSGFENRQLSRTLAAGLVVGITVVATVLRFHAISTKSFWLDEGISVELARLPWSDFFQVLWHREANMALYYVILRFWLVLGSTEGFIRGLSALFSVATVPALYLLGTRLFGRITGVLAAWLLALNAYHIRYAQDARSYSLLAFLAVVATWLFLRNLQAPKSAHWGAYTAVCVLLVYTHFYGGLLVLAHSVTLLFLPNDEVPWDKLIRSLLWFTIFMIPAALFILMTGTGPVNWIPPVRADTVLQFFSAFAGNFGLLLLALCAIPASFALFEGWKAMRPGRRGTTNWATALVVAWLFVPVMTVLAASAVRPLFFPRYLIPCLPALILLIAAGLSKMRPFLLSGAFYAAISIFSIFATLSYYKMDFDQLRDDWRSATAYLLDHAQPGDGVFFVGQQRMTFEFYRSMRQPPAAWPEVLEFSRGPKLTSRDFLLATYGDELREASQAGDRVWVVFGLDPDPGSPATRAGAILHAVFGGSGRLLQRQRFSGITIMLFARESEEAKRISDRLP
jgi:mannosyltransferase